MNWFTIIKEKLNFSLFLQDSPKMIAYLKENFKGSMSDTQGFDKMLLDWYIIADEYDRKTDIGKIMFNILKDIMEEENINVVGISPSDLYYKPLFTLQQWETHIPKFENKTNELRRLVAKKQNDNNSFNRLKEAK
jgi:hypothetical protein